MIDLKKTLPGEYVVVMSEFHDYGKVGNVFRIVDTRIPGEPTAAIGWQINKETGEVIGPYTYKLPADKVNLLPRSDLAALLKKGLKKRQKEVDKAKLEYEILHKRIVNLEEYYSRERECEEFLSEMFNFIR